MRATIRNLLLTGVPAVNQNVFEPHAASITTPKPFLIVQEGMQDVEAAWANFSTVIEVWPYADLTSFVTIDTLCASVITTLHKVRFAENGEQFFSVYLGSTGQDLQDDDWQAITRGLRFRVFSLGWLNGLTYDPDPVTTLRNWMAPIWTTVQTDPTTWTPDNSTPGIYWRLVTANIAEMTNWGAWIDAGLNAHILTPDPMQRLIWTRTLTEGLALTRRLVLTDGSPLMFQTISADSEADPFRVGQVKLLARFGVLADAPGNVMPAPATGTLLNIAHADGDVQGVVQ